MKVGLIGLPNSGKTTVFNLLTGKDYPTENFYTQEAEFHLGSAKVVDERLDKVFELEPRPELKYAEINFVDMAGFMIEGGGRPKKAHVEFTNQLHHVDALVYVVRGFDQPDVMQVFPDVNPVRDIETIQIELIMTDLDMVENRIERIEKELQAKKDKRSPEHDLLVRCKEALDRETPLREIEFDADEEKLMRTFRFLSRKPALALYNIAEDNIGEPLSGELKSFCDSKNIVLIALSAEVELEISQLAPEEQKGFMDELNISEPARDKFVRAAYALVDLISFFTIGDKEVKAWTVHRGAHALDAAGKIHSDIQRGFIRTEVVHYNDFVSAGGWKAAREHGTAHLEGKEHVIEDGDIVYFRFNV